MDLPLDVPTADDVDFRFCQKCGYTRKLRMLSHPSPIDPQALQDIDNRLQQLMLSSQATSYAKPKDSLQKELEGFLITLPSAPSLPNVTPRISVDFLFLKTAMVGHRSILTVVVSKTVDSYIGKLRSIFHAVGRDGEWDPRLCLGNPAGDKSLKEYLRVVSMEQLKARVQPKQASPFLISNLDRLATHIDEQLKSSTITPTQRFLLACDQAYFKAVFFSGDRPGDMGQVKVPEILRFPNNDGLLFTHTWGKTLRDVHSNMFGIQRNPQSNICPVLGIERYLSLAEQLQVDLRPGYLFRPTNPQGAIINAPFTSSAAEARLKKYLMEMGTGEEATLHGFRAGCAITLALSGVELSEVMDHVGWTQRHTALYYLQLAKVLNPAGVSARLAQADLTSVTEHWENANDLRQFVLYTVSQTSKCQLGHLIYLEPVSLNHPNFRQCVYRLSKTYV